VVAFPDNAWWTRVATVKATRSCTGSQCSWRRTGEMRSHRRVPVTNRVAAIWIGWKRRIRPSVMPYCSTTRCWFKKRWSSNMHSSNSSTDFYRFYGFLRCMCLSLQMSVFPEIKIRFDFMFFVKWKRYSFIMSWSCSRNWRLQQKNANGQPETG